MKHPPRFLSIRPIRPRASLAFSLTEILVVVAIASALISVAAPAWNTVVRAQGVSAGADDLANLIQQARKEAIARQTYVWVGFETVAREGRYEVVAAAACSRNGSGSDVSADNLTPLGKPLRIPDLQLRKRSELDASMQKLLAENAEEAVSPLDGQEGIAFDVGAWHFSGDTLTFTPSGEILIKGVSGPYDGYDLQIELGLTECRGEVIPENALEAALAIDGAHGSVQIVRVE